MKRLYKSSTDKKFEGVCGGVAEYLNLDATVIRVIYAGITFFTGVVPGIALYILLAIIMPNTEQK